MSTKREIADGIRDTLLRVEMRDTLNAELDDCLRQREEARTQITHAQQQIAQAQQYAQVAERNIARTEGAEAQIRALLTTLAETAKKET
jgi:hypothetical protein